MATRRLARMDPILGTIADIGCQEPSGTMVAMTTWQDVEAAQPDLARRVQTRFEDTGLALAATVRADGSPRISGWEPLFAMGELWLGGMTESRKSTDVRRDPRLALHNATADKDAKAGDAKISGRAVEVTDEERRSAFMRHSRRPTAWTSPARSTSSWWTSPSCRC